MSPSLIKVVFAVVLSTMPGVAAVLPPTVTKLIAGSTSSSLTPNGATGMSFTLTNPNPTPLTGVAFSDPYPAGLHGSTSVSNTCGGTVMALTTSITVMNVTLPGNSSCQIGLLILATGVTGNFTNTTTLVTSNEAVPGSASSASITVADSPVATISFAVPSIQLNASTNVIVTFTNPATNTIPLLGVNFTNMLPAGLTPTGVIGSTCTAGSNAGTFGFTATTISISGGTLAAMGSCTVTAEVTGIAPGTQMDSITVLTSNTISSNTPSASLLVIGPVVISKAFGAPAMDINATTSLTFTLTNPNGFSLNNIAFTDPLPPGLIVTTPNGLSPLVGCNGTIPVATAGTNSVALSGATLPANGACTFSVTVTGIAAGLQTNTTSAVTSMNGGTGLPATAAIAIRPVFAPLGEYQLRYLANLDKGDPYVSVTNAGTLNGSDPAGRICVNIYTFDPAEELVACCACPVTPNGLNSLSVKNDLISNTLTPGTPTSVTVKLLATIPGPGGTCNPSTPTPATLVRGMRAWATTLHANTSTVASVYQQTETPFSVAELSTTELTKLTGFCGFIQANGSGFGICKSCRTGALGAAQQ